MEQVLSNPCSLRLPVKPQSACAVMEMISPDDHVDRRMHLDTADLCTGQVLLIINMMNMVILDDGEYAAKMTYDTGLSAVMNITATDNMGTDPLLGPALPLCLTDAVTLRLSTMLQLSVQPLIVIVWLFVFTK